MRVNLVLAITWTILGSAVFNTAAIAAGDQPLNSLSAVYCHSGNPFSLNVCSIIGHKRTVLSYGVIYDECSDGNGRLAVLLEDGAIITCDGGKKTGVVRVRDPRLNGWTPDGLIYEGSGKLLEFDPGSGHSRAVSTDGDIGPMAVGRGVTFQVQRIAGSTKLFKLGLNTRSVVCNLPDTGFSSLLLVGDRLILVGESAADRSNSDIYAVNIASGSLSRILSNVSITAVCPFRDHDHLVWGRLGPNFDEDGMSTSTEFISMNLVTRKKTKLFRIKGQVSPLGQATGARNIVAMQNIYSHGTGKLISINPTTRRVTILQNDVWEAYPAR